MSATEGLDMEIFTDGPTLVLTGDFDVRSTWEVRNAIYDHIDEHAIEHDEDVVIDIAGITSVDVTALKVLAVASRTVGASGHHLVLRGARPQVLRLLHISRLIRLVELEREAVTA